MLDRDKNRALRQLLRALIDQNRAQVVVPAYARKRGYWFGGGNLLLDETGVIWMSGRYRNSGDSRNGLTAGERGQECAAWDVASTRITSRLKISAVGAFSKSPPCPVYFYDRCEAIRDLPENERGYHRPRGSSCEERGGVFFWWDNDFSQTRETINPRTVLRFSAWHRLQSLREYSGYKRRNTGNLATIPIR